MTANSKDWHVIVRSSGCVIHDEHGIELRSFTPTSAHIRDKQYNLTDVEVCYGTQATK